MEAGKAIAGGPAVRAGDIAEHHEKVEPGPHPALRAVIGIMLGMATGAVAVALTRRPEPAGRTGPASRARGR